MNDEDAKERARQQRKAYRKTAKGKAAEKRYKASEKSKAANKKYAMSDKGKAARNAAMARYRATPKYLAMLQRLCERLKEKTTP